MTFTSSVHFTSVSQSTFQLLFKELFMTWTCKQKSLFVKTIPLAINYCSSDKVIRVIAFLIFGVKKQSIFHLTRNWFPKMKIFCTRPEIVFFSIVIKHKRCMYFDLPIYVGMPSCTCATADTENGHKHWLSSTTMQGGCLGSPTCENPGSTN